jgi:hypothetical protein
MCQHDNHDAHDSSCTQEVSKAIICDTSASPRDIATQMAVKENEQYIQDMNVTH